MVRKTKPQPEGEATPTRRRGHGSAARTPGWLKSQRQEQVLGRVWGNRNPHTLPVEINDGIIKFLTVSTLENRLAATQNGKQGVSRGANASPRYPPRSNETVSTRRLLFKQHEAVRSNVTHDGETVGITQSPIICKQVTETE